MKDIVIGCITGYDFDKIKPWVNSLDQCGFTGHKAMICYNIDFETVEELVKRKYAIFSFRKDDTTRMFKYKDNFSIVVERFFHLWYFLKNLREKNELKNVITTDVKDVIFQTNPTDWLERKLGHNRVNVASESIKYEDEEWGKNNLLKSFGQAIYDEHKGNTIYNAGTIAGKVEHMIGLFLNIYMLCNSTQHQIEGGGGPDQAALNILLHTQAYKQITNFANSEDAWAAQLGTTGPQIAGKYGDKLLENSPEIRDNIVFTSRNEPFCLVHQYDRVPELKKAIEEKYS